MHVEVQRGRRLLMAHKLLNVVDRHTVRDQPSAVGVSELVEGQPSVGMTGDLRDGPLLRSDELGLFKAELVSPDRAPLVLVLLDDLAEAGPGMDGSP